MIGFQAPLWLLGLGLLPLIRWLHRFRYHSETWPTTTLFLWKRAQRQASTRSDPGKPDPRWMLRALISALLVLMLARPFLQLGENLEAEVWVDDSLSMFTVEGSSSRLQAGFRRLLTYLDEHGFSRIRVHSLGDPAARLSLDTGDSAELAARLAAWASQPRAEPRPPPAATLSKRVSHVLVTDGADTALNRWARTAPLSHVIRNGELRRNLVLSELGLRAAMVDGEPVQGSARIHNLGDSASRVRLEINGQGGVIHARDLEIPPWGSALETFSIEPGSTGPLHARLISVDDPLALDDRLTLDLTELRATIGYRLVGDCSRALVAVIRSHPAFVRRDGEADLIIDCSAETLDGMLPVLRLHPAIDLRRSEQRAHWHRQLPSGYLPIGAGLPYSAAAPALTSANMPILSADGRMLILQRPGPRKIIDCYLDSGDADFTREARYPLLMLALLARLSGRDLEMAPLTVERDTSASLIAPADLSTAAARVGPRAETTPLRNPLLVAVILLLLADAALGLSRARGNPAWQS